VQSSGKRGTAALTIIGGAFAVGLLAVLVSRSDPGATWAAIRSAGPLVVAALVPFAFGITADACGLLALLRGLGHRTRLAQVLPVRLASEALHLSMPAGFVASDTATAVMLESHCGVPLRDGVIASIARKWLVMRMHAVYIVAGAVVGFAALAQLSQSLMGRAGLPWIVAASSLVPLALSAGLGAGLLGRSTFARLHGLLSRVPSRRLAAWLESKRHDAAMTDRQSARLRAEPAAIARASIAFLVTWCFEAIESALVLRLVGVHIDLAAVFAIEAGLSLVRSAAVIAPSGLGVVDLGYATVLPLLGADAGGAPAFVLLKRAKEVVWVLAGYAVIAAWRARPDAATATGMATADAEGPTPTPSPAAATSVASPAT
jgi:hypothetical protein